MIFISKKHACEKGDGWRLSRRRLRLYFRRESAAITFLDTSKPHIKYRPRGECQASDVPLHAAFIRDIISLLVI